MKKTIIGKMMLSLLVLLTITSCDLLGLLTNAMDTTSTGAIPEATMVSSGTFRAVNAPFQTISFSESTCSMWWAGLVAVPFAAEDGKLSITTGDDDQIADGGFVAKMDFGDGKKVDTFVFYAAKRISGEPGTTLGTFRVEFYYASDPEFIQFYEIKISSSSVQLCFNSTSPDAWVTLAGRTAADFERYLFTYKGTDYIAMYSFVTTSQPFVPEAASRTIPDFTAYTYDSNSYDCERGMFFEDTYEVWEGIGFVDFDTIYSSSGTYSLSGDRIRFNDTSGSYIDLMGGFFLQRGEGYLVPNYMTVPGMVYQAAKKSGSGSSIYGTYSSYIETNINGERTIRQEFKLNESSISQQRHTTDPEGVVWDDWEDWYPTGPFFSYGGNTYIALRMVNDRRLYEGDGF
ncbi:MAG: hypothetical protein WAZ99_01930 [Rectinemataceae bacterium]